MVPVWESASPSSIETIKDVLAARKTVAPGVELVHARIPLTAERPPDFSDIADLMDIVTRTDGGTSVPVVLNCQLGRGRSTLASTILLLIMDWLHSSMSARSLSRNISMDQRHGIMSRSVSAYTQEDPNSSHVDIARRHSYQIINSESCKSSLMLLTHIYRLASCGTQGTSCEGQSRCCP